MLITSVNSIKVIKKSLAGFRHHSSFFCSLDLNYFGPTELNLLCHPDRSGCIYPHSHSQPCSGSLPHNKFVFGKKKSYYADVLNAW